MNIDDLADRNTAQRSPGEKFRENWLDGIHREQWASYIDESTTLVLDGIAIGETGLTKADFPTETGTFYQRGLASTGNIDVGETSLPIGHLSGREIGIVAWVCNQLQTEIQDGDSAIRSPSRAIEAAVNKSLLESVDEGDVAVDDIDTIRLPKDASVSEVLSELFCRPRSSDYVEALVDIARDTVHSDRTLLQVVEEPRMTTELWHHQRDALDNWIDADYRGYVDMATATGKTVLGLAAIAHHYGALHPADQEKLGTKPAARADDDRATVLVVAHRDIILNQWKREFDRHLNIPEEGQTDRGEHTATFSWGDVRFWTPKRLTERGVPDADLVVLDETHHYIGSSGFGSVLEDIECDILALSGSLDEADARSLERRNIGRVKHFTLQDGQRVGIIPECSWDVSLVPYEAQSTLARVTQQVEAGLQKFADGPADDVLEQLDVDRDDLTFDSFDEAQSIVRSTAGREFGKRNDEFRQFASAVKSRRLTRSNLSPTLSRVTELTVNHIYDHKCVVLLESTAEIQTVRDGLERRLGDEADNLVTVVSSEDEDPLNRVEEFDDVRANGALIGTSQTLGEGVDIKTADIGINRGRGRLSSSLIQQMGRILRNPTGDKSAHFYHVHGIPTEDKALLPREDGISLLETASQLLAWGKSFNAPPVFDALDERVPPVLARLEKTGADAVSDAVYDWPDNEAVSTELRALCDRIVEGDERSVLLALERWAGSENESEPGSQKQKEDSLSLITGATGQEIAVVEPFSEAVASFEETISPGDTFVDRAVRSALRESPDERRNNFVDSVTFDNESDTVRLNPTLAALVRERTAELDVDPVEYVNDALAVAIAERIASADEYPDLDFETLVSELSEPTGRDEICSRVTEE